MVIFTSQKLAKVTNKGFLSLSFSFFWEQIYQHTTAPYHTPHNHIISLLFSHAEQFSFPQYIMLFLCPEHYFASLVLFLWIFQVSVFVWLSSWHSWHSNPHPWKSGWGVSPMLSHNIPCLPLLRQYCNCPITGQTVSLDYKWLRCRNLSCSSS